ncbi:MAG: protein translocase subunit SecD [Buchnera aphidicola (Meitanaphis flavogallis)]
MFTRIFVLKLCTVVIVLLLGFIYACPNFYPNTLSIELNCVNNNNGSFDNFVLELLNILRNEKIHYIKFQVKYKSVFLYFNTTNEQFSAFNKLNKIFLGKKVIISLSSNTNYPKLLKFFGAKPMRLGLDLRGGTHFLLKMDTNYILHECQSNIKKYFLDYISQNNYTDINIKEIPRYGIQLVSKHFFVLDKIQNELTSKNPDFLFIRNAKNILLVNYNSSYIKSMIRSAIERNIYILKNRIYQLGIAEPIVQQTNNNCIIVELPDFKNSIQVKEILSSNFKIEFHLVNTSKDIELRKNGDHIVHGSTLYQVNGFDSVLLYNDAFISGKHILDSNYMINNLDQIEVNVQLNHFGGDVMTNITKNHIGEYIAILWIEYFNKNINVHSKNSLFKKRETVINIAKINSMLGSSFRIVGIRDVSDAKKLSILLKTGSFIAPITIIEENVIGPSIGKENVKNGILSCIISVLLCILIMITRYKKSGLIVSISLVSNLLLIIAIMSILPGIVLTMPGIASILLMLAFSIDANVLINERIREEIKNNLYILEAVRKGYFRAYFSIFDANVSMLIISIVLYIFGTDIIRNFAVTTIVGIFTSLFSSLFFTRTIIQLFYHKHRINKLSI